MSTLHLVSSTAALGPCLEVALIDDHILLLEDGVYAAVARMIDARFVYAISDDIHLRGLQNASLHTVECVDYTRFVDLCVANRPIVTWT